MREIKFRAWEPDIDFMTTNIGIDKIHLFDFQGDNITEQEELIIMQYTGLKDKNGKEIYEGDIIACKFHHEFHERIDWSDVDIVGTVFWDHSGYSLKAVNGEDDTRFPELHNLNCSESEIIGNIYETLEKV
jgi:uncharacterized phage protein (TIGR01671 family)